MEPDVLQKPDGVQLSYNVPHRIHETVLYPRKSPSGFSIIVYGHSTGIRVVWYANPNVGLFEGDDNTQQERLSNPPASSYIYGYKDIATGSPVLHVSATPFPRPTTQEHADHVPPILNRKILVAAACADSSLKLISLPIENPKEEDKDETQILTIPCSGSHQDLISSVSIRWIGSSRSSIHGRDAVSRSRSRSRDHGPPRNDTSTSTEWSLLLASVSPSGTGLLMIHHVPLPQDESDTLSTYKILSRLQLRCPLEGSKLCFNPSAYPDKRSFSLLLTLPLSGMVKIFEVGLRGLHAKRRRRSNSANGTETTASEDTFTASVRYCLNLHTAFASRETGRDICDRKAILDAAWILGGRSIIVLMEDGEWGVWDVEAAGPSPSTTSQKLLKQQDNTVGIQGGSVSTFVIRLKIDDNTSQPSAITKHSDSRSGGSSLAPMTPHTRKAKSKGLFRGTGQPTQQSADRIAANGCITVKPALNTSSSIDESVVIRYGHANILISSIQTLWRTEVSNRATSGLASQRNQIKLPSVRSADEQQQEVYLLSDSPANIDLLVSTSSRMIIHVDPSNSEEAAALNGKLPVRSLVLRRPEADQALLRQGGLDVEGIDRILDGMDDSRDVSYPELGFEDGHGDGDVDTGASTATRAMRRPNVNDSRGVRRQNLFS